MIFLQIATGIIFVLYGMRHLRKGLDRLFGNALIDWLQRMSENRFRAFTAGVVAGAIAPSSSAVAMLSMQMLSRSALTAGRLLAVVLGANVGITIAVQLLTFRIQAFAGVFIVIGGVTHLFMRRGLFRGIGQILLALGFIFLAMQMIGEAGHAAGANADLAELFRLMGHYPWLILGGIALLTLLLQSSTAAIGLGIGLAQGGLLPPAALIPWVLGANTGIALTMLTAGWGSVEGRRLGLGNLLLKGSAAVVVLLIPPATDLLLRLLPGAVDQQAANLNTFFNLVIGLCTLPFLKPFERLLEFLIEAPAGKGIGEPQTFLDPLLLQSPTLALNQATREELHMIDDIHIMLRHAWMIFFGKEKLLLDVIDNRQSHLLTVRENLREYLSQVSDENLNAEDVRWKFMLLDYAEELSALGKLIRRDLADVVLHIRPPEAAAERQEIEVLYALTMERLAKAARLLMSGNVAEAEQFIREKEEMNRRFRAAQRIRPDHLGAAPQGEPAAIITPVYFDLMNCLRRINSHLTAIAYAIARPDDLSPQSDGAAAEMDAAISPVGTVEGASTTPRETTL
jgi:phosphate:Na+ symporter